MQLELESICREAGARLNQRPDYYLEVNSSGIKDVKIQADLEAEELIRKRLSALSDFPILGEELGGKDAWIYQNKPYWIVDPLDGTYNYLRDMPLCCVSVGLFSGLTPIMGVVYNFTQEELFSGSAETGLRLNGQTIRPQWAQQASEAALMTGFPSGGDYSDGGISAFVETVQAYKKIRMIGTAALALAYVACGRADVYFEPHIKLWDVAAGLALVAAAGGRFKLTKSPRHAFSYTVCAGPAQEWIDRLSLD